MLFDTTLSQGSQERRWFGAPFSLEFRSCTAVAPGHPHSANPRIGPARILDSAHVLCAQFHILRAEMFSVYFFDSGREVARNFFGGVR